MFASRVAKVLVFALLAAVVPACSTTKKKLPPELTLNFAPAFDASNVPLYPLIIMEFDRALDPTTVNTSNVTINLTTITGAPAAPWGGSYSVEYIPGTYQILVKTTTAFTAATEYTVLLYPGIESSEGIAMAAPVTGGEALRFVTVTPGNVDQPAFSAPVQTVGGVSGQIVWTWTQAQEAAANISANYEFYMSLTAGDMDLLDNPPFLIRSDATGFTMGTGGTAGNQVALTAGVTYYFRMICRDSQGNVLITAPFQGTANP